jgi:hypothetical protein
MARSGVIYGPSGSWKTGMVKQFSHYIAETTGKSTCLFSSDGGGWGPCEPEVEAGMIRAYRCEAAVLPLPMIRKISQGYWPEDTSEIDPTKINMKPMDWNEIGGIAVEGWSSLSNMLMRYAADKGLKFGKDDYTGLFNVPIQVNGEWKEEKFGPSTQNHFGFVQNQLYALTTQFLSLPVRYVLFTALESKAEDDDRSTIYGPSIAGKKATAACPSWVGDCIHAQDYAIKRPVKVPNPEGGDPLETIIVDTTVRMYFKKHPDPATGIMFPAKPRIPPEKIKEFSKEYPYGYFEPTVEHGFDSYLHLCDKLSKDQSQAESLKGWREKMDQRLGRLPSGTSGVARISIPKEAVTK